MINRYKLNDLLMLFSVLGVYCLLYFFNNTFHFFELWKVPKTIYDETIIFSPYWIWVYLLAYVLPVFMFFYLRKLNLHFYYLQLFFILTIITNIVFFILPSYIDRIPAPIDGVDSLTKLAFEILFNTDKPYTCFPSTHVSTSFVAAMSVRKHPKLFLVFFSLALLISYSALAIGQHYIYDALSGVVVAILSFEIYHRILPEREESARPNSALQKIV